MPFLLPATFDIRPAFQLWLLPHLVLVVLPPAIAYAIAKGWRLTTVPAVTFLVILVYITSDGWLMVWRSGDYAEFLHWWMERCAITAGCAFLVSAFFTRSVYRSLVKSRAASRIATVGAEQTNNDSGRLNGQKR
jgi:hypothetical protein